MKSTAHVSTRCTKTYVLNIVIIHCSLEGEACLKTGFMVLRQLTQSWSNEGVWNVRVLLSRVGEVINTYGYLDRLSDRKMSLGEN
jgi:hypothetical protein